MEQEDDDILISKVRFISFSSNSRFDKLQLSYCSSASCHYCWFLFMLISLFASLYDQFSTWSEFETYRPKSLKVGKCRMPVRSGWSHNSNLSEERHKVLTENSRLIQVSS